MLPDLFRTLVFLLFGIGVGFMLATNVLAFRVLRGPRTVGFLWWHVTAISTTSLCLGVLAVESVAQRLGQPMISWRVPVGMLGTALFCVSQVLIFRIERQRLVEKAALRQVRDVD